MDGSAIYGQTLDDRLFVFFDGATAPTNPGPSSSAAILKTKSGDVLSHVGLDIGEATNNVAEIMGLIAGLKAAKSFGAKYVHVVGDSEFALGMCFNFSWKTDKAHLQGIVAEARDLIRGFEKCLHTHVPRKKNAPADAITKAVLKGTYVPGASTLDEAIIEPEVTSVRMTLVVEVEFPIEQAAEISGGKQKGALTRALNKYCTDAITTALGGEQRVIEVTRVSG